MRVLCALSGVEFGCDHFPSYLHSRECNHPIFSIPQKHLLKYESKYLAGELTPVDSYLLFVALLNSTDLVEFRIPAKRNDRIVAQCMSHAFHVIARINTIKHPAVTFPRFIISASANIDNAHNWLIAWENVITEFNSGYRSYYRETAMVNKERYLEKCIKNSALPAQKYATVLAQWAALAAEFPSMECWVSPTRKIPLRDYWKEIIVMCANKDRVHNIRSSHLKELIEHCEDNLHHGSIYAFATLKVLRDAMCRIKSFYGIEDVDISESVYRILSPDDSIEDASIASIIDSSPSEEPREADYPTKFGYFKARIKWEMRTKLIASAPVATQSNQSIGDL